MITQLPAIWPLSPHPDCEASPLDRLEVGIDQTAPLLWHFRFAGAGEVARVRFPSKDTPSRRDGLWQHTCAEVFLMEPGGGYCEFNLSPSTKWAAYRFESYRSGVKSQVLGQAPRIEFVRTADSFSLEAILDLTGVFTSPLANVRVGLAAVIEQNDSSICYWALKHVPGKPDFHHADGFVGVLEDNVN